MTARPVPHPSSPSKGHESGFTPSPVLPEAGRTPRQDTPSGVRSVVELTSPIGHKLRVPPAEASGEHEIPAAPK